MANLDWEAHKAEIERLYIHQDKSLKEVIQTMGAIHGFCRRYVYFPKIYHFDVLALNNSCIARANMKRNSRSGDSKSTTWDPRSGSSLIRTWKNEVQTPKSISMEFSSNPRELSVSWVGRPFKQQCRKKWRRSFQVSPLGQRVEVGSQSSNAV